MKNLNKTDFDKLLEKLNEANGDDIEDGNFETIDIFSDLFDDDFDETEPAAARQEDESEENDIEVKTSLNNILVSFDKYGIKYEKIGMFFELYDKYSATKLNKFEETDKIWKNLLKIAASCDRTEFTEAKSLLDIIQYSYNAYVAEKAVSDNLGWRFVTSPSDHVIFHGSSIKSFNEPDFISTPMILGAKVKVEVKNYLDWGSALEALNNAKDRRPFHGADMVLVYFMKFGDWMIRVNSPLAPNHTVEGLPKHLLMYSIVAGEDNKVIDVKHWNN